MAEAEAPDIRQQADADRTALRDEANIAREPGRVAQFTQIRRARVMRIEHAHAVRPA